MQCNDVADTLAKEAAMETEDLGRDKRCDYPRHQDTCKG